MILIKNTALSILTLNHQLFLGPRSVARTLQLALTVAVAIWSAFRGCAMPLKAFVGRYRA